MAAAFRSLRYAKKRAARMSGSDFAVWSRLGVRKSGRSRFARRLGFAVSKQVTKVGKAFQTELRIAKT